MEDNERKCEALSRKYERAKRMFGPDDMDKHVIYSNKYEDMITDTNKLFDALVDYRGTHLAAQGVDGGGEGNGRRRSTR